MVRQLKFHLLHHHVPVVFHHVTEDRLGLPLAARVCRGRTEVGTNEAALFPKGIDPNIIRPYEIHLTTAIGLAKRPRLWKADQRVVVLNGQDAPRLEALAHFLFVFGGSPHDGLQTHADPVAHIPEQLKCLRSFFHRYGEVAHPLVRAHETFIEIQRKLLWRGLAGIGWRLVAHGDADAELALGPVVLQVHPILVFGRQRNLKLVLEPFRAVVKIAPTALAHAPAGEVMLLLPIRADQAKHIFLHRRIGRSIRNRHSQLLQIQRHVAARDFEILL